MNDPIDEVDHSHARFAFLGGALGALVALIIALTTKFLIPKALLGKAITPIMFFWPGYMAFAYSGANASPLSGLFIQAFLFSIFLNFLTYWIISGVVWCGLHWHSAFFVLVGLPIAFYWNSLIF